MSRTADDRRNARQFGLLAEFAALLLLTAKGYRILARRYHAPGGEIDVIALKAGAIAFVEIKARADIDDAATAITEEKRRRISKAARFWLARRGQSARFVVRGDAIFIAPWRRPRHVRACFALDLD